ncbi:NAD(P)/FAD-dependent oxidoreductase [Chryseosolibacter indicus]|uniref:FAD-binding oxidoreductase n=1 Tax=Chryseosolibacter indicus TaxID=2782351 RepID=A0ABS5VMK5_9BACT|nr:FAD-dependent oxidoreductase [Chryseosolibacter indicus]MBT1702007.1 FAD-binding oxidoreductase [Chryseosolibacter indicus]
MRQTLSVDYIIVGQGLAGSALAVHLMKMNKKFVIIDGPTPNSATRVAAGLFNPVTGKNLVKTWLADKIFPYLHTFYPEVEKMTGKKLFYSMPLYRPFVTVEEQNEWMGRSTDETYKDIIDKVITKPHFTGVHDPLGGLLLKQCGFVDTQAFLEGVRNEVSLRNGILDVTFNHQNLVIRDNLVCYDHIEAPYIIFCEGVNVSANPWFDRLPIRSLKGETLTVRCFLEENNFILNRGVYLVPIEDENVYRVGATYNLQDKTPTVTMAGKFELEEKLNELVAAPYEITGQAWGFRPTTVDRRPIMGKHPYYKSLVIFNGLGTKGISLAPYFSQHLIQCLENATPLYKEVDVARYKLLY